ncbi:TetR/AcrR family transcriptional regulator C-terminal domain-containing protein [Arthrobacter burdickii]|uniref:TetR/AcrR family transcriptional regulator C-terminal domain-containing protein n=1 Tax=Arthrobacter burdickii TaxID=3035920 RepID=A0ABT8K286_9MICC|nr:TetR/AcrR family transcriptional regulator C-terminal domain-containing protein [Arthrobacter burdickii]MDN4611535.1 TetR/AcrR family transcriptional regulator C-terminal domain-containing protein [Arthrobacter burdickii]
MTQNLEVDRRVRLNRDRVLQAAVFLADETGIDSLSMRRLAQELQVVPMALYKHVSKKEELLDGMVETIIAEIDPSAGGSDWKSEVRQRVLSARRALQRHPWARQVIESRTTRTPAVLAYWDSFTGMFLAGGLSVDLTHHVMHAMGGRMWGFTQELFDDPAAAAGQSAVPSAAQAVMLQQMTDLYPNIAAIAASSAHDGASVVGQGCDDQFEFEFALDLLLDGFERLHRQGWSSKPGKPSGGRQD